MNITLAVAAGGAAGAVARYWLQLGVHGVLGPGFPYGTLTANVIGSGTMGVLYVLLTERYETSPELRLALTVGLLGAFTTFSTFSMETVGLIQSGAPGKALINVALSVTLCVAACWGAVVFTRTLGS